MNVLYLLLSLNFISFSFAKYGPTETKLDLKIGANTAVFRIGRDIYSYGGDDSGNLFKYGIDENKNIYSTRYKVKDLEALCLFCFSFVMENDSVLTLTGYDGLGSVNGSSTENNMGVYYFNPVEQTAPKGKDYKKIPGSPVQRGYHQAVMTPDKKSVYIFGGIEHKFSSYINISIVQFDISSSTFINHQLFRFIGGTATMLPSGIAVLAFGAFNINTFDRNALYDTSSVFLYDTTKNEIRTQNISGTPPLGRASASGTLGPDNECIYYYGGSNFDIQSSLWNDTYGIKRLRVEMRADLVVLNTTSWTWIYPDISGPSIGPRYEHFSLLYEDNSLIIGGGLKKLFPLDDICVLKNLPTNDKLSKPAHLRWFTSSNLDDTYNMDSNSILTAGAIAGIVIGSLIIEVLICYYLWKKFETVKRIIWKRRLGEPAWTEILRAIIRFILLGVLVSYIAYSTLNAMNSSITSQEKKEDVIKMPLPDIRVCSRFEEFEGDETYFDAVTAICDFGDGRDCSPYFYPVKNPDYLPVLDDGSRSRNCMVFIPPLDIYFHTGPDTDSSLSNDQIELRLFRKNVTQHIIMFYLTYYPNQNSPYRTLFKMNGDDTKMSIQDAEDQLRIEKDTKILKNTYDFGVDCFATTTYSLTKAQTLTNSSWNYFGFSNIYEVKHSITTYFGPKSAIAISDIFIRPTLMVRVKPNEYSIRLIIEQKVSTILGGLASVGGVLSVIMFVQTLLFGFRPNSPWGIIHRWSWGRRGVMLRDQLRNEFNTDDSPVPIVTRVRGDSSLPELSDSTILGIVALNENDNVQNDGSKLKKMEDRIQLMEDLFKAYYIDDEIFQKLNEARKEDPRRSEEKKEKMKRASGFTTLNQEDDKASINQTDQKGKSKVLP